MWTQLLTNLALIFGLSLIVTLIFYGIGKKIAPKGAEALGKLAPYACGEDLPPVKLQVDVERFFIYVVYFMVFDILVVIMATSFMTPGLYPSLFAVITLVSAAFLLLAVRRR